MVLERTVTYKAFSELRQETSSYSAKNSVAGVRNSESSFNLCR